MLVLNVLPGVNPSAGAERSFALVAPELIKRGVRLHLAVFTERQGLVPQLESDGVVVHDLSSCHNVVQRTRALRRVVASVRPDVVHATLWDAAAPAQLASLRSSVPLVITWAALGYSGDHAARRLRVKLKAVALADRALARTSRCWFHAVTEGVAEVNGRRLGVPARRIRVVERGRPRPVDPTAAELASLRSELALAEDARVVLAIGRQEPVKDHVTLIAAVARAARELPQLRLLIGGRAGAATSQVNAAIERLDCADRVDLLGQRDDIPALLGIADAFALSSRSEGAAGGAIEAMIAEVPIVATDVVGQRGVLEDRVNSLVVPVGDADAMAAALVELLAEPQLAARLREAARRTYEARFTIGRSADGLVQMYREVVAQNSSRSP